MHILNCRILNSLFNILFSLKCEIVYFVSIYASRFVQDSKKKKEVSV